VSAEGGAHVQRAVDYTMAARGTTAQSRLAQSSLPYHPSVGYLGRLRATAGVARARAVGMQSAGSRDPRLSWCLKDVRPTRNYNIHGEDGVDDVARGRFLIPGPVRANFPFARLSTRVGRAKR
jgi:hypothetical protein